MKTVIVTLAGALLATSVWAAPDETDGQDPTVEDPTMEMEFDMEDWEGDDVEGGDDDGTETQTTWIDAWIHQPLKYTLQHEMSRSVQRQGGLVNNRSSIRLEYSKFFSNNYYLQFDTKTTKFWGSDHRNVAQSTDTLTREAYIQGSWGNTSVKLGVQTLIWGESDAGAITDVISPRNLSELFFINLEESRLGQGLINIEQYTDWGNFSGFYIPNPKFNEYPQPGTEFEFDPFGAIADVRPELVGDDGSEYGVSWKKTFGKSDFTLLAASLIDNNYGVVANGFNADGKMILNRHRQRFELAGFTFNYATGDYLFSGEIAAKLDRGYNDPAFNLIERDTIDTALKAEYSLGANDSISPGNWSTATSKTGVRMWSAYPRTPTLW